MMNSFNLVKSKISGTDKKNESDAKPQIHESVLHFNTGTIIYGEIYCPDNCYFDGKVFGNVTIGSKLVLGVNSEILGNVIAENLLVKGKVTGNITCNNKTVFEEGAVVKGRELKTKVLSVENGAILNFDVVVMTDSVRNKEVLAVDRSANKVESVLNDDKTTVCEGDVEFVQKADDSVEIEVKKNDNDDLFLFNIFQNH